MYVYTVKKIFKNLICELGAVPTHATLSTIVQRYTHTHIQYLTQRYMYTHDVTSSTTAL